jgi:MarR family transcriptional regulator, 2-MHQ and catechol-resistance regulon repressor
MKGKFQNEWHKLRANLLAVASWLRIEANQVLEPFDLTQQQFNVLRILRGSYPTPLSTAEIRERMLDKMSDASRLVDRLCAKGWVEKKACTEDKRLVNVLISEAGQVLLKQIDKEMGKLDQILQVISEEEAKILNEILDRIENSSRLPNK